MENSAYVKAIRKNARLVVLIGFSVMIASAAFSFLRPLQYSSTVRLLVIQKTTGLDPYTAIRSAERISDNLSQIIYTTSFFDQVLRSGFDVDERAFPADERKRRRAWHSMIATQVARGTGMLTITVYHKNRDQASQIAQAISYALIKQGSDYVGGDLNVRLVDAPLQSRFPVRPNIPANAFSGLILGVILGIGFVFGRAAWKGDGRGIAPDLLAW